MRNFKGDLKRAEMERMQESISNIKLPNIESKTAMFRPGKYRECIPHSDALKFKPSKKLSSDMLLKEMQIKDNDCDLTLKNIRQIMITKNLKLKGISVEHIDQIYRFEKLNDFSTS